MKLSRGNTQNQNSGQVSDDFHGIVLEKLWKVQEAHGVLRKKDLAIMWNASMAMV